MQVHERRLDSICYPMATSKRLISLCYGLQMTPDELQNFRVKRLDALVEKLGSNNELGRRLGMANGTFIGQMRRGERAITEKFIAKVESTIRGSTGWFSPQPDPPPPNTLAAEATPTFAHDHSKIRAAVLNLGEQLTGLDEYRRNAIGQLLLGLSKNPEDSLRIADDVLALIANQGKLVA